MSEHSLQPVGQRKLHLFPHPQPLIRLLYT
ncbi:BnaC09g15000D [Brassica napus]|uniref:BnaC09g15000D protein n=1 Tax=Brassica napus TaxID=3708 RepID=A0A078GZG6_BRANA|nr:BnaC09g15000D [Brassica napus]